MSCSQGFEENYETETPKQGGSKFYYSPQGLGAPNLWNGTIATRQMGSSYRGVQADGSGLPEDYISDSLLAPAPSAPRNFNLFVSHPQSRPQQSPQKDVTWKPPRLKRSADAHEVRNDKVGQT